jgi:hypothetical protein
MDHPLRRVVAGRELAEIDGEDPVNDRIGPERAAVPLVFHGHGNGVSLPLDALDP